MKIILCKAQSVHQGMKNFMVEAKTFRHNMKFSTCVSLNQNRKQLPGDESRTTAGKTEGEGSSMPNGCVSDEIAAIESNIGFPLKIDSVKSFTVGADDEHHAVTVSKEVALAKRQEKEKAAMIPEVQRNAVSIKTPKAKSEVMPSGGTKGNHVYHHHIYYQPSHVRSNHQSAAPSNGRLPQFNSNGNGQDLRRFLDVIGTEPKEARYWFRYFQKKADYNPLFAVIQIEDDIIRASTEIHRLGVDPTIEGEQSPLDELCNYIAFLQRHEMKCLVVHGSHDNAGTSMTQILADNQLITDLLETHGALVRQMTYPTIHAKAENDRWRVTHVDRAQMDWALGSGHIPVVPNVALTASHQLVGVDVMETTAAIARHELPLKVLLVNRSGGWKNARGKVVANVNLPHDEATVISWGSEHQQKLLTYIKTLLTTLHTEQERLKKTPDSAVVVTDVASLLTELFTHHGSGTFFKITEKINSFFDLEDVNTNRLVDLIQMSFGKDLKDDYIDSLQGRLEGVFISEGYSAAAVVTREEGVDIPYLDKFVVRKDHQDNCVGRMMWDTIRKNNRQLFWRSRNTNLINPWYFKKSEGSWSDGEWTVFWYGISNHRESSQLIDRALSLPNSFQGPGGEDWIW